jgi:hypothetical protein
MRALTPAAVCEELVDRRASMLFLRYLPERLDTPGVRIEGTRRAIRFSRAPVQVGDRDPAEPGRFRGLHTG